MRQADWQEAGAQERALSAYLVLTQQQVRWGGRLVIIAAEQAAEPAALGALAAGAAVLWIEQDPVGLRSAGQRGVVDFQVTTLTEAIRVLKNEIRRKQPVSVGLLDVEHAAWEEALLRGLQPYAVVGTASSPDQSSGGLAVAAWRARGAVLLEVQSTETVRCADRAADWRARRQQDAALLLKAQELHGNAGVRASQWHTAAPRLFPRDLVRCDAVDWAASDGEA